METKQRLDGYDFKSGSISSSEESPPTLDRLTLKEYNKFCQDYFQSNKVLRMGQAFVNKFLPGDKSREASSLYDMKDVQEVQHYIMTHYVDSLGGW